MTRKPVTHRITNNLIVIKQNLRRKLQNLFDRAPQLSDKEHSSYVTLFQVLFYVRTNVDESSCRSMYNHYTIMNKYIS